MSEVTPSTPPRGIRPLVAGRVSQRGVWLFAGAAILGGIALFASLEHQREAISAPAIAPGPDDVAAGQAAAPDIVIPREPPMQQLPTQSIVSAPQTNMVPQNVVAPAVMTRPPRYVETPAPVVSSPPSIARSFDATTPASTGPEVVFDASRTRPQPSANGKAGDGDKSGDRVRATQFVNPGTTVPKGAVIQAVLESALDSTRAGLARAIISRDVYAFDGSKVLIPKGSRLIGEYKADLALGQARALIQWQRLMRPDGAIIELDSPSADPLGRAGVKGKVHSHFVQKFGGAILQSALDVGVQVATNKLANGSTIYALPGLYALPGAAQNGSSITGEKVQPNLTVKEGTSVSVFVARDLDFSSVE